MTRSHSRSVGWAAPNALCAAGQAPHGKLKDVPPATATWSQRLARIHGLLRPFLELFQSSSDAVYLSRLEDGVILDVNESFLSLRGLTAHRPSVERQASWGSSFGPRTCMPSRTGWRLRGRVERRQVRMRNLWSEEFTLALSVVVTKWRETDVILGIGRPVIRGPVELTRAGI